LALVAEHVVDDNDGNNSNGSFISRNPFDSYDASRPQNEIIGYVLGKVEETAILTPPPPSPNPSKIDSGGAADMWGNPNASEFQKQQRGTEMLGHVTSLAILPSFRRRGLAAKLMKQLHYHMQEGHDADGVGLHVRVSNVAARRLYCEGMGYGVVDVIRGYYQDGEDAFFMRKNFDSEKSGTRQQHLEDGSGNNTNGNGKRLSRFSLSRMRRGVGRYNSDAYQNGPKEYMLPIIIPLDNEIETIDVTADSTNGNVQQDEVQVVVKEPEKKRQTVSQSQFQKIPSTIKSKSQSQYQKIPSSTSTTSTRTVVNASTAEEGSTKVMSGSL
jgi:ribosomal protein S18 acetylase RimI-like enzyme